MKTNDFPLMLSDFLLKELPVVRNQSNHTVTSYKDTYIRLLEYCRDVLSIKPEKLSVSDLTADRITDYLNWLEREHGNSISTRNQRLAAIHSLFRFIQMQAPEHMFQCQQVLGIPYKKAEKHQVGYLSEDETKTLLAMPDTGTKKGRRDQALLTLLYDSGARVQELADLRVCDLRLDPPAQVKLTGKGRKTRSVPLMDKTAALMKRYLSEHRMDVPSCFDHPLFFNPQGRKLTRQGVAYILKKYADECGITEISPHKLRHTKAMHLTEADVNPIFIRDFLGHTDLKVTEVYSKTSIKMKKAALDKMKSSTEVVPDAPTQDWTEDKTLLDWLNGLKQ
ncbi:MAG: site-specific integrase [Blautia sp.]|nr:site-specific integrase [Blautia sp.]